MQHAQKDIPLVPDVVETNEYSTRGRSREGKLIMSTTIAEPGAYTFSCRHPDGGDHPKYVLAFGQNLGWEFIRAFVGAAGAIISSFAVVVVAAVVSMVFAAVVAIQRWKES
jgi:hypothetical protein